ncbi:hypothetical protein B0H13DRAFT_2385419 [Mycena leptocephala]|nr:hypothetical protein B0H13DRAFT_2385419 [Mycena leptocephala]
MTTVSTKDSGDTTDYISTITVKNSTQYPITRDGEPVTDDGQYQSYPPIEIDPGKEATWVMKGIHNEKGVEGSAGDLTYLVPYRDSGSAPLIHQAKAYIVWRCPVVDLNDVFVRSSVPEAVTGTIGDYTKTGDLTVTITIK